MIARHVLLRALIVVVASVVLGQVVLGFAAAGPARPTPATPIAGPNPLDAPQVPLLGESQAVAEENAEASSAASTSSSSAPGPNIVSTAPVGACAPGNVSSDAFIANVDVNISLFSSANMAPVMNAVSGYAKTVQISVDTDKVSPGLYPIVEADIEVWAVGWNNESLNSTLPNSPAQFPMLVDPARQTAATGQLNDFKFFPPGSYVYFGISIFQNQSTPYNWTSPCPIGEVQVAGTPPGTGVDQPTWMYRVGNGWPSPYFEQDIQITATPNVFGGVVPDPFQSVYFFLNSTKIGFPIGGPLGGARLYYTLDNRTGTHPGGSTFCPNNATYMNSCFGGIPYGIGPFYEVGDIISFQFEAFVSTDVGIYNKIFSKTYNYEVGAGGTWCSPNSGYVFSHWIGTAEPPYYNSSWQNGNYTGGQDPASIYLHGPVVENALFNFVGSQTAVVSNGNTFYTPPPPPVVPEHPGIQLAAPTSSPSVPGAGFPVNFVEQGLPAGSVWSVLLGADNQTSNNFFDTFSEADGTYAYQVTSPIGEFGQSLVRYVANPIHGAVTVNGALVSIHINFTTQVYLALEESTYPPTNNPWTAGNVSTTPTAYGANRGWYDNNTEVNLSATAFFGFPYFLSLTSNTFPYVVQNPGNNSAIPAFTGVVNLTLSSQNATTAIAYAYVFFNESYNGQLLTGEILMNEVNSTVYYTGDGTQLLDPDNLGPFPPGTNISFYVLAYDELGCPIRSDSYAFHTAITGIPQRPGQSYFYVAVFDQATGQYVPNVPVNISNNTWWDDTQTNLFGFAWPNASFSTTPLYLNYGEYNVTVTYDGFTQSVTYQLSLNSNKTLTFIFDSAHTSFPVYAAATTGFPPELIFGSIVAGATAVPIALIWYEQRRKAAAEEKRVTL